MTIHKPPFTVLAQFYDTMMAEMEYDNWAEFVLNYLKNHDFEPETMLDVACGTASSTVPFSQLGLDVSGLDLSADMLVVAKQKLHEAKFYEANMLHFDLQQQFDLVGCLFDSLNNLLSPDEVLQALKTMLKHTRVGGYVVADINTKEGVRELWEDDQIEGLIETQEGLEVHYHWSHHYDPSTELATIQAFFRTNDGEYLEQHTERGYDPTQLEQLFTEAGFSEVEVLEYPDYAPPTSDTPRVWVFAKRLA